MDPTVERARLAVCRVEGKGSITSLGIRIDDAVESDSAIVSENFEMVTLVEGNEPVVARLAVLVHFPTESFGAGFGERVESTALDPLSAVLAFEPSALCTERAPDAQVVDWTHAPHEPHAFV